MDDVRRDFLGPPHGTTPATVIWFMDVFIKMMLDFQSFQEDTSAHVMHYVWCHILLALIQKKAQY